MEAGREGGEDEAADRNDLKMSDSADLLPDCGVKNFEKRCVFCTFMPEPLMKKIIKL